MKSAWHGLRGAAGAMPFLDFNTHPGTQILEHTDTPSTRGMQHFCLSVCLGVIHSVSSRLYLYVCASCVRIRVRFIKLSARALI